MRTFRLLNADEIECRAQSVKENGVVLLLYKTARTDAQLLDETFGIYNWQCDYKLIDGTLYCGIGIRKEGTEEFIWKWNCGVESNTEAEKGRASDALKRAGYVLGAGTELYSSPFIFIPSSKCNIQKRGDRFVCNDEFVVSHIGYDKQERITSLEISVKGSVVWKMGAKAETGSTTSDGVVRCEKCGKPIIAYEANGKMIYPPKHIEGSKKKYGKVFCIDCINSNTTGKFSIRLEDATQ